MSKKTIEQISSEIDVLLAQELKIEEFAFQKLKEFAKQSLEESYQKTRESLGKGTCGNAMNLGLLAFGSLFSKSKAVNAYNESNSDYERAQTDLDEKWHIAKPKLDSLSPRQLFWILALNRKNGFE